MPNEFHILERQLALSSVLTLNQEWGEEIEALASESMFVWAINKIV